MTIPVLSILALIIEYSTAALLNKEFILSRFDKNPDLAVNLYIDFVTRCNKVTQKQELLLLIHKSITKEPYEYRSYRHIYRRDLPPETIIKNRYRHF